MPTTATFSSDYLVAACEDVFPAVGAWGYLTLLGEDIKPYTANVSTNVLTTATPHGLLSGSRIKLLTGTPPAPLALNVEYYAIVFSFTSFALATTIANSQSGIGIDITTAGAGTLTLSRAFTNSDTLPILVSKEISHPNWLSRKPVSDLGVSTSTGIIAQKPPKRIEIANTNPTLPIQFRYLLAIASTLSTTASLGNVPVAGFLLVDFESVQSVAPSTAAAIDLVLSTTNL
jgi:hypothetical protein